MTTHIRSTLMIYKDLYRVARHMGAKNGNKDQFTRQVTEGFRKNMYETNKAIIEEQRGDATRLITNYLSLVAHEMNPPASHPKRRWGK
eukprot:CAMPEP_0201521988 /NCGR_PEP_ID=MMETSP0161_2-20130828/16392_1 /ASSEMBLY_ACC=CAM_ASM_000251 /TAXON_ID=180227 /ORGANISM="Neoparamoeba aestuarina, Strain SoJaBio B1-5/56/2" /LENGTH=87 /DNA_ID=CAMNT_0047920735 /DNA_START=29 /DNA_END=292 /DNA_ORIENTATION=-